jgi:HlyD family secretion protein
MIFGGFMTTTNAATPRKPRRRLWFWILGILVVLAAAFFAVPLITGGPNRAGGNSSTAETVTATPQPYVQTVTGSGTLTAIQSRDLAPEVTGVVATVVESGTRVKAGDVLVQLDTDTFERDVRDAQFALEQAEAQRGSTASTQADNNTTLQESIANAQRSIANAERDVQTKLTDLNLKQRLVTVGGESSEALRQAQSDYDTAVATLEQARLSLQTLQESQSYRGSSNAQTLRNSDLAIEASRNSLEKAQEDLTKTTIVAPFDGVVATVNIKTGSIVNTTTAMLTILDDSKIELPAQIDETEISKIQRGQSATVTLDALPGETFQGEVTKVASAARIVSNIPIFDVTVLLDNSNGHLRDGMSAEASITVGEVDNTVTVPSRAVTLSNGQNTVELLQADGSTKSVSVQVVASEGLESVIQGDIPAGSKIMTTAKVTSTSSAGPFGGN